MFILLRDPVLIWCIYIWRGFELLLYFSHCHQTIQLWGALFCIYSPQIPWSTLCKAAQGILLQKAFFHVAFWWAVPPGVAGSLIFTKIPAVLDSSPPPIKLPNLVGLHCLSQPEIGIRVNIDIIGGSRDGKKVWQFDWPYPNHILWSLQ